MTMARCFVALWPPPELVEALWTLHRKDQPGVRFVEPDNWHITLRFFGRVDIEAVTEALNSRSFAASELTVGPVVELLGDHTLMVRVDGAEPLAAEVNRVTRDLGEPPRRRFVGHLSLARLSPSVRRGRTRPPTLLGTPFSERFTPTEVALVESHLHPGGARYTTLATWPVAHP